jgi:carboxyl-terminal processing protease
MNRTSIALLACFATTITYLSLRQTKPSPIHLASSEQSTKEIIPGNNRKHNFENFRMLAEVTHLLEKKHFKSVDFEKFIVEALKSAVPSTDAHSSFFPRDLYKSTIESTSGEFSGIGVSIMNKAPEDESMGVIDVIEGGPSHKAGLKPGDKIVEVAGEAIKGLCSDEVITKLKGKTGTKIKIKVIRQKKPMEFSVTRDIIKDQSTLCYRFEEQNIFYISLKIFAENSYGQLKSLIKKAQDKKSRGIILDLRRNPGGVLDSAVDLASLFVDKGSLIVETKNKSQNVISKYYTNKEPIFNCSTPLFILIDNFTASASEILSGCLKYYSENASKDKKQKQKPMAILVGTETFGKGSVQEVIPLSNGCAMKITTMMYYLPGDSLIQAQGIKPDLVIKPKAIPADEIKWITELYGKETSLRNHITPEESRGKKKPEKKEDKDKKEKEISWEEKHKKAILGDTQIQACVNMITMINLAQIAAPKYVESREQAVSFLKKNYLTDEEEITTLEQIK